MRFDGHGTARDMDFPKKVYLRANISLILAVKVSQEAERKGERYVLTSTFAKMPIIAVTSYISGYWMWHILIGRNPISSGYQIDAVRDACCGISIAGIRSTAA